ncbi:hypothetical protein YerA41_012 [Yersinia phage YerA41]|nr:hypothetical protein YerA41_012 [Yersinia phage YerA41]
MERMPDPNKIQEYLEDYRKTKGSLYDSHALKSLVDVLLTKASIQGNIKVMRVAKHNFGKIYNKHLARHHELVDQLKRQKDQLHKDHQRCWRNFIQFGYTPKFIKYCERSGWHIPDGHVVRTDDYPILSRMFGTDYQAPEPTLEERVRMDKMIQDMKNTPFNVPDFQGMVVGSDGIKRLISTPKEVEESSLELSRKIDEFMKNNHPSLLTIRMSGPRDVIGPLASVSPLNIVRWGEPVINAPNIPDIPDEESDKN